MSTNAVHASAKCSAIDVLADAACPEADAAAAAAQRRTTEGKGITAVAAYYIIVIFIKIIIVLVGAFLCIPVYHAVNWLHLPTFFAVVAAWWIMSICGPNAASMLPDFATNALYKPHSSRPCTIGRLRQLQIILRPANTSYRSPSRFG